MQPYPPMRPGLASFNTPMTSPAPPPRIGVRPAIVPPPPVPTAPSAPAEPGLDDHAQLRNTILGDLRTQVFRAQQSGDRDALYDLAAQRGALDNGGFQGLARYRQESLDSKAQRDALSAKADPKIGSMSPDELWQNAMLKTGDPKIADAMAQRARISQADATAAANGKPAAYNADDAGVVLQSKYPAAFNEFVRDDGQNKHNLPELYAALAGQNIPGFADPKSEFSQLARQFVPKVYGGDLANQLEMPSRIEDFSPGWGANPYIGNLLTNLWNLQFTYAPNAAWEAKAPSVAWWKQINAPPAP